MLTFLLPEDAVRAIFFFYDPTDGTAGHRRRAGEQDHMTGQSPVSLLLVSLPAPRLTSHHCGTKLKIAIPRGKPVMLKRQRHGSKLGTRAGAESTEPRCGPPRCWQRSQRLGGPARRRRRPWRSSTSRSSVRGGRCAAASGIGKRLEAEKPREGLKQALAVG